MSNNQKVAEMQARLDAHNKKTAVKVIAKAVALNIVVPIVATVAAAAIINKLNEDK